jgi:phosphoribosyl 1,2-cyclic phosphodiesterase
MITLYVLGSGSRGNCFAVESDGMALLIDAGFSAREIERRAVSAGLDLRLVAGIALTDAEHRALGFCSRVELGAFSIEACATSHDAAEPLAMVIRGSDGTSIGVAYDLGRPTSALRYLLRGVHALVLEANHDEVQLRTSDYPPVVQRRIAGSTGHLSNRAAAELLAELHHPGLGAVVLAHLSEHCNTAADARTTVARALRRAGFRGALHVADQDRPLAPILVVQRGGVQLALAL